jgi:hypothetical protein
MNTNLNHEIGTNAGTVYRFLFDHEAATATTLKKETGLTARQVDQALGWLAREAKVVATTKGKTTTFELV